jgi:hypothetical protein
MDYSKFKVFLSALELGLELEINGRTYALGFDSKDRPRIAHKVEKIKDDGTKEEVLMQGLDLPDINNFIIYIMEHISDEDVAEIAANMGLNKIKKENLDKRK